MVSGYDLPPIDTFMDNSLMVLFIH